MKDTAISLPELHVISSNCIRDLIEDKITEKKANSIGGRTNDILNTVKLQMTGFKTFGKSKRYDMAEVLYGKE